MFQRPSKPKPPPPSAAESHTSDTTSTTAPSGSINNTAQTFPSAYANTKNAELSDNTELSVNTLDFYENLKSGNLNREDAAKAFNSLSQKEQREFLDSLSSKQIAALPIIVCEYFPEFIDKFVNNGRGTEIINNCSAVTANSAIRSMKNSSSKVKIELSEYIINNQARFSQISYEFAQSMINNNENKPEQPLSFRA